LAPPLFPLRTAHPPPPNDPSQTPIPGFFPPPCVFTHPPNFIKFIKVESISKKVSFRLSLLVFSPFPRLPPLNGLPRVVPPRPRDILAKSSLCSRFFFPTSLPRENPLIPSVYSLCHFSLAGNPPPIPSPSQVRLKLFRSFIPPLRNRVTPPPCFPNFFVFY